MRGIDDKPAVTASVLNVRIEPAGKIIGNLSFSQQIEIAQGYKPATKDGFDWLPVVVWVASKYVD